MSIYNKKSIIFGLTGGICSGKSTVAKTFIKTGVPIVDADLVARQVVQPGTPGLATIVDTFGQEMLLPDGTLNRAKMAEQVFSHPDLEMRKRSLSQLNAIMAPLVHQEGTRQLNKLQADGYALVGWDAAILIEAGNADKYRPLIVVYCPTEVQCQRLMVRNSLTRERAMDIIIAQMPGEQKIKLADYVIYTDGSMENSIRQTVEIIHQLKDYNETNNRS